MRDLEIVVVGAGIGGLTSAVALKQSGHRVRVLDQARELRPVGAGISLWSNGVKVLDSLGLGDEIAAVGGTMERLCYRDAGGETLCDFSLQPLIDLVGERPYPVRRADLQALLLAALDETVLTGQRCVEVADSDNRVTVTTERGDTFESDLVVVADGTHSRLRTHVLGQPVTREFVGYHNLNGIVPNEFGLGDPQTWTLHVGEGKRVSTMPVRDGQYFFFDVPSDDPVASDDPPQIVLKQHFGHWDERVQRLIDNLDPAGVAAVAIHTHAPIENFARGNVVLLGDSAHTTAPDLGQGGCLAMEDALVLTHYLKTTSISVADALRRYSEERVPRTGDIVLRALKRAQLTHAHDPARTEAWYAELAHEDGINVIEGISRSIMVGPCR